MKQLFTYLKGDKAIWVIALIFGMLSVVTVYSFIPTLVAQHGTSPESYLIKHVIIMITGFFIMYYIHRMNFKYFSRMAQVMFWMAVILLFVTAIAGSTVNHAKRWIEIPVINQSFQTSDFAKLAIVAYVARLLVLKQAVIHKFKEGVWPVLWPVLLVVGLILPYDFSTAMMVFGICLLLMFIGRVAVKHLALIVGGGLAAILLLFAVGKSLPEGTIPRLDTWKNRIEAFWNGEEASPEALENKIQQEKALSAIYNGGIWGKGPGKGQFKRQIPQGYADYFFASFIEEFGAIGGMAIVIVFMILLYRSIRNGLRSEKNFGTLLCIGLSLALMIQAMINMAVPTGLVPVTGQNMPMLGLGGTSIWFTCISLGMILSVSRSAIGEEENQILTTNTTEKNYNVA